MLQNPNFPGLHPGPRWESLQRSHRPLTYRERLNAPAKNLTPSGLVSMGLRALPITELATVLMIDFKYRPVSLFPVSENEGNVLSYEGADGAMPPREFLGKKRPCFEYSDSLLRHLIFVRIE